MAFKELIGTGYVELTAEDAKLNKNLDSAKKKMDEVEREFAELNRAGMEVFAGTRTPMERYGAELTRLERLLQKGAISQDTYARAVANAKRTMESSLPSYRNIGKFFLMGAGIGTAEQVINKVSTAVVELAQKMSEAASKGEAVGNAIARWAEETLKLNNAVGALDRITAREKSGRGASEEVDKFFGRGRKEQAGDDALKQLDQDRTKLKADLAAANQKSGFSWNPAKLGARMAGGNVAESEEAKNIRLELTRLASQEAAVRNKQAEDEKRIEDARKAQLRIAREMGRIENELRRGKRIGTDIFNRASAGIMGAGMGLAGAVGGAVTGGAAAQGNRERADLAQKIESAENRLKMLQNEKPTRNAFMGIEELARSLQGGANDTTSLIQKQIKVAEEQLAVQKDLLKKRDEPALARFGE